MKKMLLSNTFGFALYWFGFFFSYCSIAFSSFLPLLMLFFYGLAILQVI